MRAILILSVVAGLSHPGAARAEAACAPPTAERATLTVKGTATVERRPDTAHLAVSVRTRGPALDGTARDHRDRVARAAAVLDHLRSEGVSVEAGEFSLDEERAPVPPGGRPSDVVPTYRADTWYDLALPIDAGPEAKPGTKLGARLDAVVAEIASAGLFELGRARFSVSDDAIALDDVRRAAIADAKRQAQIYAEGADMRLDGVDRITDGAAESPGFEAADLPVVRLAAAGLPRPSVGVKPPKALSFSGSVTVVWHIVSR